MKLKEHSVLKRSLLQDGGRYESLAAIFAGFKSNAQVATKPEFDIKGIAMADDDEGALIINFAGKRVRFSFRFERSTGQGSLVAEEVSDLPESRVLWAVSFNGRGETDIDRRDPFNQPFSLHQQGDCIDLILAALDQALGAEPV